MQLQTLACSEGRRRAHVALSRFYRNSQREIKCRSRRGHHYGGNVTKVLSISDKAHSETDMYRPGLEPASSRVGHIFVVGGKCSTEELASLIYI